MSQYKARRSFYGKGQRFKRGSIVDFKDTSYLTRLEQRGLVVRVPAAAAPAETKVIAPAETKTPAAEPPAAPPAPQQPAEVKVELDASQVAETVEPVKVDTPAEAPESPQEAPNDLDALSYKELKEMAKAAGIKGYNTMKQKDLVKKLKEQKGDK